MLISPPGWIICILSAVCQKPFLYDVLSPRETLLSPEQLKAREVNADKGDQKAQASNDKPFSPKDV
jgi:hypothetical protein